MLQITMTATLRPLLDLTLSSLLRFARCSERMELVLNIDPAPRSSAMRPGDVLALAERHMEVAHWHAPARASFSRAVRHVWTSSSSDVLFHVEDDWEFIAPIELDEPIAAIRDQRIDYARFGALRHDNQAVLPEKAPDPPELSLTPALWNGALCREMAAAMTESMDPEKQLWRGVYPPLSALLIPPERTIMVRSEGVCRDIGRAWRKAHGLSKWRPFVSLPGSDFSWRTNE